MAPLRNPLLAIPLAFLMTLIDPLITPDPLLDRGRAQQAGRALADQLVQLTAL